MRRGSVRRRLTPEDRTSELLDAGERVIRRKGLSARVEDVVADAGAAKGTFYVYFPTWENFLVALRERAFAELEMRFDAYCQACSDWPTRIGGLPKLFIELTLSLEGLHPALFHGPIAAIPPQDTRFDIIAKLARLIGDGIAEGTLNVPDRWNAARFTFAILHEAADIAERGIARQKIAASFGTLLQQALGCNR